MINPTTKERNDNNEQRSFNILGKPFQIRINDLIRYPNTLLADSTRLQSYWRSSLNAYFFSRDVHLFERVILPFYTASPSSNTVKRPPMISLTEKLFREELAFYNLLEYYQTDDILNVSMEHSSLLSLLSRLLIQKSICRCVIDCISCISCALAICEMLLWRCRPRWTSFLLGDVTISLILLWTSFFELHSDQLLLKIRLILQNKLDRTTSRREQFAIIGTSESPVFMMQVMFASLPFIATLLSHNSQDTWYFMIGLAFRHLLLMRLCFSDLCHLIDILHYSGRSSLRVVSHFVVFIMTVIFVCIWIGLTLYVTDSNSMILLPPSRYVYFVYQILLNVGYGDTTEQSLFSFLLLIVMTLIACPLLIIIYRNFIEELNRITIKFNHIHTWHHPSSVNSLISQVKRCRRENSSKH